MNEVLVRIGELGLVPVIKIERAGDAVGLGRALVEGDLPVAEVTFRTDAAEEAIKSLTAKLPDLLVGAGTVLTPGQAERAVNAGARFIVSPGFNPKVVDWCIDHKVLVTPGINSPTQLEMALERDLSVVKFFPAEASGGLAMLKAMAAPYGGVKFIPTGGINEGNLASYLAYNRILACGGSWMVKADLISAGKFDEITRLVRQAVATVHGFALARVAVEATSTDRASKADELLSRLFHWPAAPNRNSFAAGPGLEVSVGTSGGEAGHLSIVANNLERAVAYLKRKGVATVAGAEAPAGGPKEVVLDLKIGEFSVHLLQK